jgi:hypothetical protein
MSFCFVQFNPSRLNGTGAHDQDRTDDLVLTKDVLYRLSYMGLSQIMSLRISS